MPVNSEPLAAVMLMVAGVLGRSVPIMPIGPHSSRSTLSLTIFGLPASSSDNLFIKSIICIIISLGPVPETLEDFLV